MTRTMRRIIIAAIPVLVIAVIFFIITRKAAQPPENHYRGTIGSIQVFVSITSPARKITGEYFYNAGNAVAKKESLSLKQTGGNLYKLTVRLNGKKLKGTFTGIISADSITGNIVPSDKAAKTLGLPAGSHFPVQLLKEIFMEVPGPDFRYEKPIFDSVTLDEGILFGSASGYYSEYAIDKTEDVNYLKIIAKDISELLYKKNLKLYLDFYQPYADTLTSRPLILLLHGGAFLAGDRRTPTIRQLADYLCRLGYIVASADYRLGFNPVIPESMERCSYRGVQDARAALRYLVFNAPEFAIDTSNIFIGGTSAGAITALYTAYLEEHEKFSSVSGNSFWLWPDLGCLDCSGNALGNTFRIKGVVNMWGALHDTAVIDPYEKIPLISFHGTDDNIVPFGHGYPFAERNNIFTRFFLPELFGSGPLHEQAGKNGIPNMLITFEGYDHEPQIGEGGFNSNLDTIQSRIRDFLYFNLSPEMNITGPFALNSDDTLPFYTVPSIHGCKYYWQADGGKVLTEGLYNHQTGILWTRTGRNRISVIAITPAGKRIEMKMEVKVGE